MWCLTAYQFWCEIEGRTDASRVLNFKIVSSHFTLALSLTLHFVRVRVLLCQAKVTDLNVIFLGEEYILRLQVSVQNLLLVEMKQP